MEAPNDAILRAMTEPAPSGRDRRRNYRATCNGFAEVVVSETQFLFRGEIRDLSTTGCFIATRARLHLAPEGKVELRFTLKNTGFRVDGRIANVRQGLGIGVEFYPIQNLDLAAKFMALCEELSTGLFANQNS